MRPKQTVEEENEISRDPWIAIYKEEKSDA